MNAWRKFSVNATMFALVLGYQRKKIKKKRKGKQHDRTGDTQNYGGGKKTG